MHIVYSIHCLDYNRFKYASEEKEKQTNKRKINAHTRSVLSANSQYYYFEEEENIYINVHLHL